MPKLGKEAPTLVMLVGRQHNKKSRYRVVSHPLWKEATLNCTDNIHPMPSAQMRGRKATSAVEIGLRRIPLATHKDRNSSK